MNTSLFYEILLYLNSFYFGMFAVGELIMFVIKFTYFPIASTNIVTDFCIFLFLIAIESVRILLGRRGNLTENSIPVIFSIILTFPAAVDVLYCLLWQTYVLRLEWILCIIQLSLQCAELVLAIISLLPFYRSSPY